MNYKSIILIALALCLCVAMPVSAVWQNGNWIEDTKAPDVNYNSVTGVSSKYVPTDNTVPTDYMGTLYVQTLTYHALIGAEITIQRVEPTFGFTNGALIQSDVAAKLSNASTSQILSKSLNPRGTYEERLVPGIFLVTLLDGNGGQPEYALGEVFEFYKTDVGFLGHGISGGSGNAERATVYNILEATYGATECHDEIDVPAHEEYRYWMWGHGHWSEWSDHEPHHGYYEHRHVDATYKTVCTGTTIPVTSNVQEAVGKGYISFLFDNSLSPGGIYDLASTTLLSAIPDPAPGIEKNVYIHYTRDGSDLTINTMEYLPITL